MKACIVECTSSKSSLRLKIAFEENGHECTITNLGDFYFQSLSGDPVAKNVKINIEDFDVFIFRNISCSRSDEAFTLAQYLKKIDKIVFDKTLTEEPTTELNSFTKLAQRGIPIVETFFFTTKSTAREIIIELPHPLLIIMTNGQNSHCHISTDWTDSHDIIRAEKAKTIKVKEFVEVWDIYRAYLIENQFIGCIKKTVVSEENKLCYSSKFKNSLLDPTTSPIQEIKELAIQTSNVLGLSFASVDIVLSDKGPLVLEFNRSAGFKLFSKLSGIDYATKAAEHVVSQISQMNS